MSKNMRECIQQGRNFLPDNQLFWTYNNENSVLLVPKKKKNNNLPEGNRKIVHKDLIFTKEASENNRKTAYLISNTEIKC